MPLKSGVPQFCVFDSDNKNHMTHTVKHPFSIQAKWLFTIQLEPQLDSEFEGTKELYYY